MRRLIAFFVFAVFAFAAAPLFAGTPSKSQQKQEVPTVRVAPAPKASSEKKAVIPSPHNQLVQALSRALNKNSVQKIFSDPRLQLDKSVVAKGSTEPPAPSTLLTPESIERGQNFCQENEYLLWDEEKRWGVEREAIVAILRVESNFGKNLGSRSVLNTLYSIYILDSRRREFAFGELVAFIELAERYKWDPFAIKGSIAGAMGFPQFIPSSYKIFAVDGNGDGIVDLFAEADAIYSAAYYLKTHGWGKLPGDKRKAVFAYNHSSTYVNEVLDYAALLKEASCGTWSK